jgi:DNA-binding transcriptional LysR family regulator
MNKIDLHRVDLNLLVVFETLMSERHVGRAAERLSVSQSAVSHALSRLRELFDDPLFTRIAKGIEPTKRSHSLSPQVTDILNRTRAVLAPNPAFDPNRSHRFTIGQTDGSIPILVSAIERLRAIAPNIDLHVRRVDATGVIGAIDRHELDLALAVMPQSRLPARISREIAMQINYVCLARYDHPVIKRSSISPEEFISYPHIAISPRGELTARVDELLAEAGLRRNIVLTIPHFLAAPLIVERTDLIAIIDDSIARLFPLNRKLKTFKIPVKLRPLAIEILMARARKREPSLSWLREQFLSACDAVKNNRQVESTMRS